MIDVLTEYYININLSVSSNYFLVIMNKQSLKWAPFSHSGLHSKDKTLEPIVWNLFSLFLGSFISEALNLFLFMPNHFICH